MITESMSITDDYQLQDILYRACGEALHRAQTALARLNLVSITILEKLTC